MTLMKTPWRQKLSVRMQSQAESVEPVAKTEVPLAKTEVPARSATEDTEGTQPADSPAETKLLKVEGAPLESLQIAVGDTVEVLWEVECENQPDESVWWSSTVEADDDAAAEPGSARLTYVAQHGFERESRRVVFLAGSFLWDAQLKERLPYRKEGEEGPPLDDEEAEDDAADADGAEQLYDHSVAEADLAEARAGGALKAGMPVKARFQGGERYCAGTIVEVHADATYDVLYEDNVCEQNVPRDMIELVALKASVRAALQADQQDNPAAESIEQFFELFVSTFTSTPGFMALPADKQQFASEKVRARLPQHLPLTFL